MLARPSDGRVGVTSTLCCSDRSAFPVVGSRYARVIDERALVSGGESGLSDAILDIRACGGDATGAAVLRVRNRMWLLAPRPTGSHSVKSAIVGESLS